MTQDSPVTFAAFAQHHKDPITEKLKHFFQRKKADAQELSPTLAHSVETLEKFVSHGGKQVRSLLVVLGYLVAKGKIEDEYDSIYSVAAAVECVHKYLLILDDVADQDETRNDRQTVWKKYETEFAERGWRNSAHHGRTFAEIDSALLASFVPALVDEEGASFIEADLLTVIRLINKHMYFETVAGWQIQYELNHVPLKEATEADFMKGLELVTARYTFVAPLEIGLILGNEYELKTSKLLESYGVNVGTAFQIQDDILGLFGDPGETGKPVGNDVREGKKTLLLQKAYKMASDEDKKFLEAVCGYEKMTAEKLARVQAIVKNTGALLYSQKLAASFIEKGILALKPLPNTAEKSVLIDLANFVIQRKV